jgi:hydroxymethylglutaryl-CoA reductase (NADPH)
LKPTSGIVEGLRAIKEAAEATTRSGKLIEIEQYSASRMLFTRFDYTTGDAAGQNLTGKATQAACKWIVANYPAIEQYFLESNFATDKKTSQVNILHTRGKRVVAEAVITNDVIRRVMRSDTELMFRARQVSNLGGFMSGVNNNGAHSANGITAMFIATGQDAANVAESSAALVYAELRPNGDYYYSVTIPSLIVATYGGGTGLATQRECLELLGCYGSGKVMKFAEIVAATVLCGELSLGSAIVAEEWVESHDLYGRNRP